MSGGVGWRRDVPWPHPTPSSISLCEPLADPPPQGEGKKRAAALSFFRFEFQTARTHICILAARPARGMQSISAPKVEGAGKTGCALHPRSRAQKCMQKRTRAYRFSGSIPAFPAQWFYGLLRALPGDQALLSPSPAIRPASLTPTLRRQDHTTSPYASAPFVRAHNARDDAIASIASRSNVP